MKNIISNNLQIFQKKSWTFCESFKISLNKLKHKDILNNPRQLDPQNVANLLEKFVLKDCNRLDSEHYVSTLICRVNLLQGSQTKDNLFKEPQHFDPQYSLLCVHEKHHLEATCQFLTEDEE